jgi:hypothetical protein
MAADNIAELRVCCDSKLLQEETPSAKKQKSGAKSAASVGCDWIGKMRELQQHKENCEYVEVGCRHGGRCEWKGRRNAAQEHEVSCEFRKEACQHCNGDYRVRFMDLHLSTCHRRPVVCRNGGCDISHPYADLKQHLDVCSKQPIKCPYHESVACSFVCAREDMPAHADDAAAHFKAMMGVLQSTRDENKALVAKVNKLEEAAKWGQGTIEWQHIFPYNNTFSGFQAGSKTRRVHHFDFMLNLSSDHDEVRLWFTVLRGYHCRIKATAKLYYITTAPVGERLIGQATVAWDWEHSSTTFKDTPLIALADIDRLAKKGPGRSFTLITTFSFRPLP